MYVSREELINVFLDTKAHASKDEVLINSICNSVTYSKVYPENELLSFDPINKSGVVTISKYRSIEAAEVLHKQCPNKKIAVLNFANAYHPGGGVESGSKAQEEAICRVSTLFFCLTSEKLLKEYYFYNKKHYTPLASDRLIYTPNVTIFKKDVDLPYILKEKDYFDVDIITCAAPNLRSNDSSILSIAVKGADIDDKELYKIHYSRAEHILVSAIDNKVEILVLGAFGCGAFQNNPYVVATAYRDVLNKYRYYFDEIHFAVYAREFESANYDAFKEIIKTLS